MHINTSPFLRMTTTTTTINSTTFDSCIEAMGKAMSDSYLYDENGDKVDMDDEQADGVEKTVDQVKNVAIDAFGPLFKSLLAEVSKQAVLIEQLRGSSRSAAAGIAIPVAANVAAAAPDGDFPTVEWLKSSRKNKTGVRLTGYNCFTMFYMAKHKSGFPPKGIWEQQNKAAWNALAQQVVASSAAPATTTTSVSLPETKGTGKKITAYNMYTIDYMKQNPGVGFPPKGAWANVSKEEAARYQALADAAKAQRA